MRKKQPTNLIDRIDQIFSKKRTGKDKRLFIIIGAVVGVFLIYTLFLSPYAQCVSGYVKHEYREQGYKTKSEIKARAKMQCKALGR
jgi:hypothetical protein